MPTPSPTYTPHTSFFRVATACPEVSVADVATNIKRISDLYNEAVQKHASLVVFPELSVTGYTIGDLVQQKQLLAQAEKGIQILAEATPGKQSAMVVGFPLSVQGGLYNCAAVLAHGKVQGIVPKSFVPTYNEFYERRWFETWAGQTIDIQVGDYDVPFGIDLLFDIGGVKVGVEICEDLWVAQAPSIKQALQGALIIANPSASPEQIGRAAYRRNLVNVRSGELMCGYAYAGCDTSESTADIVMGGHQVIAANATIQAERKPFGSAQLVYADIDIDHLEHDRRKQHMAHQPGGVVISVGTDRTQKDVLVPPARNPFLPGGESPAEHAERLDVALTIQARGLAMRMKNSGQHRLTLGLSGGLDSTLALLVAHKAAAILGKSPADMIHTLTMPGPASSEGTQTNAQVLAKQLGVSNKVIPIGELVALELAALEHDGVTQDVTYENTQARARTNLLFNYANQHGGMVLGTGDLSEIALGWCTYNGDQQSHYNVNASIPKTLVQHLVRHASKQAEYESAKETLTAILDTVISPELTTTSDGTISQSTEEQIGPYELHDFFLYHLVRWGDTPAKIMYLAGKAFENKYEAAEITKWFQVFTSRFARSQFKRENAPNGPKVGSVSLSQRGDWRMPPDMRNAALWEDKA